MNIEILKQLKEERTTYREMIDFCCDSMVLNNEIIKELTKNAFYFDVFCGDMFEYYNENWEEITKEEYKQLNEKGAETYEQEADIYQYFIVSAYDAERLKEYTNELVIYNEQLDLYLLCVCHFGTGWSGVSANWKNEEDLQNEF